MDNNINGSANIYERWLSDSHLKLLSLSHFILNLSQQLFLDDLLMSEVIYFITSVYLLQSRISVSKSTWSRNVQLEAK